MTVDLLVSVFGARTVISECIDSWFPIPKNFNLWIYNNTASDIDGTTEYLLNKQKEYSFNIIDERKNLWHPNAIEFLISKTESPWILHLDSDVKIKNKDKFFEWIYEQTQNSKYKCYGRLENSVPLVALNNKIDNSRFLNLPRIHQSVMFFNREFFIKNELDFYGFYIDGVIKNGELSLVKNKKIKPNEKINIKADTGWKLFYSSVINNCFCYIPDEIYECWEHKNKTSMLWKMEHAKEIVG